jgi:hypothetical protein
MEVTISTREQNFHTWKHDGSFIFVQSPDCLNGEVDVLHFYSPQLLHVIITTWGVASRACRVRRGVSCTVNWAQSWRQGCCQSAPAKRCSCVELASCEVRDRRQYTVEVNYIGYVRSVMQGMLRKQQDGLC